MELNKNNLFSNLKALAIPFSEVPRNYAKGKVSGAAKVTAFALPLLSVSAALLGVGVLFLMPHQLRNVKLAPVADFMSQHARAFQISGLVAISLGGALATAVLARTANNLGRLASEPKRIFGTLSLRKEATITKKSQSFDITDNTDNEDSPLVYDSLKPSKTKSILLVTRNQGNARHVELSKDVYNDKYDDPYIVKTETNASTGLDEYKLYKVDKEEDKS